MAATGSNGGGAGGSGSAGSSGSSGAPAARLRQLEGAACGIERVGGPTVRIERGGQSVEGLGGSGAISGRDQRVGPAAQGRLIGVRSLEGRIERGQRFRVLSDPGQDVPDADEGQRPIGRELGRLAVG